MGINIIVYFFIFIAVLYFFIRLWIFIVDSIGNSIKKTGKRALCSIDKKYNDENNAILYNHITIDSIDHKLLYMYPASTSRKKKGLLGKHVEIIYLAPGPHEIRAHGMTYSQEPTTIHVNLSPGISYVLGANENGIYCKMDDE